MKLRILIYPFMYLLELCLSLISLLGVGMIIAAETIGEKLPKKSWYKQ